MTDLGPLLERIIAVLDDNRLASVATVDPDGWPHCTMVGFANDGVCLHFLVARQSQKAIDLKRDDRISIAIGRDVIDPVSIRALAIKARAHEVVDEAQRKVAREALYRRRPALRRLATPSQGQAMLLSAEPVEIRLLDYSKGYGRSTLAKFDAAGRITSAREEYHDWAYGPR